MDSCFSFHSPGEAGQGVKDGLRPPSELFREVQKAAELAKRCQVAVESARVPKSQEWECPSWPPLNQVQASGPSP